MRFLISCIALMLAGGLVWSQPWREIQPPPTRQDISQIYQRISLLDPLDDPSRWKGADHGQSAKASVSLGEGREAGRNALRIIYEFTGRAGLEYVDVAGSLPLADDVQAIGIWMKGGPHPLPARVRIVDANGECFQYDLGRLKPGIWTLGVASLDSPGGHWGGDNNGRLERPCRIVSFVFDKLGSPYVAKGEFFLSECAAYRAVPARWQPHGFRLFVPEKQELLIYEPGQQIVLGVAPDLADKTIGTLPAAVSATLTDPFGRVVIQQRLTLAQEQPQPLVIGPLETGAYDLRLRLAGREEDLDAPWADFRFAVLPRPVEQTAASPFGVSTHFGQAWPRTIMPAIARASIKFYRDEIYWSAVETEQGRLTIPEKFRAYIAEGQRLGLEPLIILDYANKFYNEGKFPVTPEARAGFARYGATVARELPAIRFFEVWNEWCGGCGMGYPGVAAEYAPLFRETAQALRAARPQAKIIGIGGEGDGRAFKEMMADGAGAAMDGFSIHPYMYPGLPGEGFAKHLQTALAQAREAAGKPLPLWITEIGWPTQRDGRGSDWLHQARCLVRMMLIALANGAEKVFWYDFKDDGESLTYNEHNFGLVHHEKFALAPKPAYVAYAHLIRLLQGRRVQAQSVSPPGVWTTRLEGMGAPIVVYWADALEGPTPEIRLPERARVEDMFGRRLPSGPTLQLTADPIFVILPQR